MYMFEIVIVWNRIIDKWIWRCD